MRSLFGITQQDLIDAGIEVSEQWQSSWTSSPGESGDTLNTSKPALSDEQCGNRCVRDTTAEEGTDRCGETR